jgi:hypothetical protein
MSAEIHNIRDYQSKRAIERAHKELEKDAAEILAPFVDTAPSEMSPHDNALMDLYRSGVPYGGKGIDGMDLPDPA